MMYVDNYDGLILIFPGILAVFWYIILYFAFHIKKIEENLLVTKFSCYTRSPKLLLMLKICTTSSKILHYF